MPGERRREYDWDRLRALLMLLGIPYHASMAYNLNVLWDIQSPEKSAFLTFLSGVLVTFRMPVFFILAGYFAAMTLEARPAGPWLKKRVLRLGVPFLTGLFLLAPPQLLMMNVSQALNHTVTMGEALASARAEILRPGFDWIMHLWFLPSLIAYSALIALALHLSRRPAFASLPARLGRWLESRRTVLFPLLVAIFAVWELALRAAFIELERLGPGLPALAARGLDPYLRNLPYFVLGALLRREPVVRETFRLPAGWPTPLAAFLVATIAAFCRTRGVEILDLLNSLATGAAAILIARLMIGFARLHWNRPSARVARIVEASFTVYLLHHPIVYGLATAFILLDWPPVAEFVLIALFAFLLSYGAHRLIRLSPFALFLFNGVRPPARRPLTGSATLR